MTMLEMLNLVMCGISSYNFKQNVASDIGVNGQYLPEENIESQLYLNKICQNTIILRDNHTDYSSALQLTGLDRLQDRHSKLSLTFANKCLKNNKNEDLFPLNVKSVNTRQHEKYFVTPARTECLAKSAVPYLQRLLNNQQGYPERCHNHCLYF